MRLRTRLLLVLLVPHLALVLGGGWLVRSWMESTLRQQAESRARAVGAVLAGGGFTANAAVIERMRTLTGYAFRLVPADAPPRSGTVRVAAGGLLVEVDYRNAEFQAARLEVLVVAAGATVAGAALLAALALLTAHGVARPLERLALAAERIGAGDLDTPVAAPGGGAEVAALADVLERARVRLGALDRQHRQDERLATLGVFTATIAHEVRNPLSAVRLTVQLAARERADARLAALVDELDRLDLTVDELLGYARGMGAAAEPCDLAAVAADILRLLRRQAEHAGIALRQEGAARVLADPRRLRQLLLNLVLNALQAQRDGRAAGTVAVRIRADGLEVEDDGPGVDPALVPRLFDAFASGRPDGTGLGLHLAKTIAEAHGARLAYLPGAAGGARFVLSGLAAAAGGRDRPAALS